MFAAISARSHSFSNARRERIKQVVWHFTRFGEGDGIKENRDAGISRREFNYTGNRSFAKLLKNSQNLIERFLESIVELLAYAYNQCGISEGGDVHQFILSC